MTCDERAELLLLHAMGTLEGPEEAALRAHLEEGCPRCEKSLAEAMTLMAELAHAAPPSSPPAGIRDRLLKRIKSGDPTARPIADYARLGTPRPRPRHAPTRWTTALAAMIGGLLVGGGGIWLLMRNDARLVGAEEVQVISFAASEEQPLATGRIFWDHVRHRWHVWLFHLNPPTPGRVYALWIETSDQRHVLAGTFNVDADRKHALVFDLPQDIGPLVAATVTEEPDKRSARPTGRIVLSARLR